MPTEAARDGEEFDPTEAPDIPDGFYLVADSEALQRDRQLLVDWLADIIDAVREVTHIAPPDDDGEIMGWDVQQEGVVFLSTRKYSVCSSVTDSRFAVTTEVYPDSAKATDEQCNAAQVACVVAALDFLIKHNLK